MLGGMESNEATNAKTRASWIIWMHVAGVAYPAALLILFFAVFLGGPYVLQIASVGLAVLAVGTFAFIGGWGRYLSTKS